MRNKSLSNLLFKIGVLFFAAFVSVACEQNNASTKEKNSRNSSLSKMSEQPVAKWTSQNGNILLNGKVFHIKGANWFGLETESATLFGLSKRSIVSILDWLKAEEFNALRIPLSVQWSLDLNHVPCDQKFMSRDMDLAGKPWPAILDKLITESAKRGIAIMLDMHTIGAGDNLITKRWYNDKYSICDFRNAWHNIINMFGDRWNIMGLDLKNELHDVSWGTAQYDEIPATICARPDDDSGREPSPPANGLYPTDWKQEVEVLVPELAIVRKKSNGEPFTFNGLYIVQGMHHGTIGHQEFPYDITNPFGFWFGGNLEGIRNYPLVIPNHLENKIAYTIHVYGPSVHLQEYYDRLDVYNHPENLYLVFESQNGFVERVSDRALIIGEWGGINEVLSNRPQEEKNGKDDAIIIEAISKWFPENCIADAFWWAINPESGDTGGLFTDIDYATPIEHKLERARVMMPSPSQIFVNGDKHITFEKPGAFNPKCIAKQDP